MPSLKNTSTVDGDLVPPAEDFVRWRFSCLAAQHTDWRVTKDQKFVRKVRPSRAGPIEDKIIQMIGIQRFLRGEVVQPSVNQDKGPAAGVHFGVKLHLLKIFQNILPLLLAQLLQTTDGRPAAIGDPFAERGNLDLAERSEALICDLFHQPGEAYCGGEFMVSQYGEHISARVHILQDPYPVWPAIQDIPQYI